MRTHLSHILPVWKACEILGEPTVFRIGTLLLRLRESTKQHGLSHAKIDEEMQIMTEALFFRPPTVSALDSDVVANSEPSIPPHIAASWKRWIHSKSLALDKATFLLFLVPDSVQPNTGGHMGLFDCLVYALQGHAIASSSSGSSTTGSISSSSTMSHTAAGNNTIYLPDVLIFLAICRSYRDYKFEYRQRMILTSKKKVDEHGTNETEGGNIVMDRSVREQKIVWTMALMAYRIYDSFLKKGFVIRDTVHRFMTDIYGEDSFRKPNASALLDVIFHVNSGSDPNAPTGLEAIVLEQPFCKRCLDTLRPDTGGHMLLDWVSVLGNAMTPLPAIPPSVNAFLEAMNSTRAPLCQIYALTDQRLYEIKRRFHSLVQHKAGNVSPLIQGDPMSGSDEAGSTVAAAAAASSSSISSSSSPSSHRNVITELVFCKSCSQPNEEMGSGGYVPDSLAKLIFRQGCSSNHNNSNSGGGNNLATDNTGGGGWGLYNVLQFGCMAVRHDSTRREDPDTPLVRFLFHMFQQQTPIVKDAVSDAAMDDASPFSIDPGVLTRTQVAYMLWHMSEYVEFRTAADRSPLLDAEEELEEKQVVDEKNIESTIINGMTALRLGLITKAEKEDTITLKELVDKVMEGTAEKDAMTFEEFCSWNKSGENRRCRLDPIMMEMRLITAVLFGIPPTLASMEITLIAEIEKRHKRRYPQTEVSRRGPRGTVWNVIDAAWFKAWASLVKRVAGTKEDPLDGRGDPRNDRVRGLQRISNTGLLENGSLSLRPGIRWKHEYEIIPPLAWSALQAWYDGGPPIHRSVVKYVPRSGSASSPHSARGTVPTDNEIELYPYFVTVYLCDATSRGEARPFQQNFQLSRVSPIQVMLVQLCRELDVDPDSARLWVMRNPVNNSGGSPSPQSRKAEDWILNVDANIDEQRKRRNVSRDEANTLLLELKDKETGLWPRGADGKDWALRDRSAIEPIPSDLGDGVVGLYNSGNTCYLNASIQCLSHTPILREYFTSKACLKDINTTNPMGHKGRLAQVSAVLINELWKRSYQTVTHQPKRVTAPGSYSHLANAPALTPRTFKETLEKCNDTFAGNEQHDAQELLAFLLDGLSEDLNRIVDKPFIEQPDSDGRPDSELADIWWSNHLKREMSIIVALFTGQYKSLLTCRTCKYESARFEPFTFLQLPLPEDEHLTVSLIFYSAEDGRSPMKYCVRVKNDGKIYDVLLALAKIIHDDENEEHDEDGKSSIQVSLTASSEADGEEKRSSAEIYHKKAQNMTVVVMREGYIARMAPNRWSLQEQQNKESGELPLLHIYEFDPLPDAKCSNVQAHCDKNMSKNCQDVSSELSGEEDEDNHKQSLAFVAVAQRRSELQSRDFLHPLSHRVFGTPLLLRIHDLDSFTNRNLYEFVARRLKSVVPKAVVRFLTNESSVRENSPNKDSDIEKNDEKDDDETDSIPRRTRTDMEEVSAGPVPRFGFRLRITSRDGRRCLRCPWYECCIGCLIPDDDKPTMISDGDSIVVDWHLAVDVATNGFGMRQNTTDSIFANQSVPNRLRTPRITIKMHSTCGTGTKKGTQPGAVTLEECIDAFAKEEKIPEAYCSKCKDFRVQTKRMSLWRLPPVMIIHLKRFQFTTHMRRKLRDLVVFPVEGLDLSRIVALDSTTPHPDTDKQNGEAKEAGIANSALSEELKDDGRSEMLYDLYGVIHHQGALSGGHYVASLKSELDGQWRLFNDAQIYEIHARDVVDPSAYMLFYIRRDVAEAQLSDYWDVREGGFSEEVDKLLKEGGRSDRCTIS